MKLREFFKSLSIVDKTGAQIPFQPNWAQEQLTAQVEADYREGRPTRIIVLKARQLGVSTWSEATLFARSVLHPHTTSFILAHEASSAENLFNITKNFYETWPFNDAFPTRYSTRHQMTFKPNGSNIHVKSAERRTAGRSYTAHCLHASEVAFWSNPEETMLGITQSMPALPGTIVILESTANGLGNFFEQMWTDSTQGLNDFEPFFFPWFGHYEYIPCLAQGCRDGSCDVCKKATKGLKPIDSEERDLVRLGVDKTHLAWRRWAVPNLCYGSLDKFHQEYPSTPDESFLTSGVNVFERPWLDEVFDFDTKMGVGRLERKGDGVEFVLDSKGPLRVFRRPSKDTRYGQYFVGADPCFGSIDGDLAAAQVINRQNHEQVAVFEARINPIEFADQLALLGFWYNTAPIACEVEGPGYATIGRLVSIYPRVWHQRWPDRYPGKDMSLSVLGFSSTWKRKAWAISKLAQMIEKRLPILHDRRTYEEMRNYTFYGGKGFGDVYGAAYGHDDLVMALAICLLCESTEASPEPYELASVSPSGPIMGKKVTFEHENNEWLT